jgi:hypothetical protein
MNTCYYNYCISHHVDTYFLPFRNLLRIVGLSPKKGSATINIGFVVAKTLIALLVRFPILLQHQKL